MDDEELTAAGLFMWLIIAVAVVGIVLSLLLGPS